MALYPGALQRPLTTRPKTPLVDPVRFNVHTAVTDAKDLFNFFQTNASGVFSHFFVAEDGKIIQYMDTAFRAASDYQGNSSTISVETWDGATYPLRALNDAQLESVAQLYAWVVETHPTVPLKLAKDNKAEGTTSHGLSYHRMGVPGYAAFGEAEGGVMFSTHRLKECPGELKIAQIPEILNRAQDILTPPVEDHPAPPVTDPPISEPIAATILARLQDLEDRMNELSKETALQTLRWPIRRGGEDVPLIQEIANTYSQIVTVTKLQQETLVRIESVLEEIRGLPTAEDYAIQVQDALDGASINGTLNLSYLPDDQVT